MISLIDYRMRALPQMYQMIPLKDDSIEETTG